MLSCVSAGLGQFRTESGWGKLSHAFATIPDLLNPPGAVDVDVGPYLQLD
jgi:hypothetical protein